MLTAMCEGSLTRLTKQKELPADLSRPGNKRVKSYDQDFKNQNNIRWVIEDHLPSLQYEKIEELCSREEFKAIKDVIQRMIDLDFRKRPRASEIKLPSSFEASCCSISSHKQRRKTPKVNLNSSRCEESRSLGQQASKLEILVPSITVEEIADMDEQRTKPVLLSMDSNLSFPYSQDSTDRSLSPAIPTQKEDESRLPAQHDETTLSSQEVLTGLTLFQNEPSANLEASRPDPWTAESISNDLTWEEKLNFFEERLQDDSSSNPVSFRTFVEASGEGFQRSQRMSIPNFTSDFELQLQESYRRQSRQPTWPPERPTKEESVL